MNGNKVGTTFGSAPPPATRARGRIQIVESKTVTAPPSPERCLKRDAIPMAPLAVVLAVFPAAWHIQHEQTDVPV